MKKVVGLPLLVIALLCSSLSHAGLIRSQHGDYAFVFPQGWTMDRSQKDFTVVGPNKVELSEIPLPPPPSPSLEFMARLLERTFVSMYGASSTGQAFDLSGRKWAGRAVVLDLPSQPEEGQRKIVAFVAKSGKKFRNFYFLMPAEEWQSRSQQYLAILNTLKFPDSGYPSE